MYPAIRINQRVYGAAGIAMNGDKLNSFENSVLLICGEKDYAGSAKRYNRSWARAEG